MWQIRAEQWAALQGQRLEIFARGSVGFLRAEAPEVVAEADDEEVFAFALRGARKGLSLGFDDPHCLQQLVLFTAWYGEGLWDAPWAHRIFARAHRTPESRVAQIEDYLLTRWEGSR